MKKRVYFLAYDGIELVSAFESHEGNKDIEKLSCLLKKRGYSVKEVSVFEYKSEQRIAEEKDLKGIFN